MRGANLGDPPELTRRADVNRLSQIREYRLITPLFGGGVRPGEADPVTTVRGSTVRGQLRFWWRATRGGHYGGDLAAMKRAEDLLWGAASAGREAGPSLVEIAVDTLRAGQDESAYEVSQAKNGRYRVRPRPQIAPGYAAFPLQPNQDVLKQWDPERDRVRPVRVGVQFQLSLALPARWKQGDEALFAGSPIDELAATFWAWETFGGIGARVRRGFGVLDLLKVDGRAEARPRPREMRDWLGAQLVHHVVDGRWPEGVPHLPRSIDRLRVVFRTPREQQGWDEPTGAWGHLVDQLSKFRQWRDPPAPSNPYQPGRSRWPEPDALRRRARSPHPYHRPRLFIDRYPRAVFGLPIVVHFKDRGDPEDYTIQGADPAFDRMASQLLLRPLSCGGDKSAFVGLAIVLEGPRLPPGGIGVKPKGRREVERVSDEGLKAEDLEAINALAEETQRGREVSPFEQPAFENGRLDLLTTFLNFLER